MNLVAVELRRLWSRGATKALLGVLTLIILGLSVAMWQQTMPMSPSETAMAQKQYEEQHASWEEYGQTYEECLQDPPQYVENGVESNAEDVCSQMEPRLENFLKPATPFSDLAGSWLVGTLPKLLPMILLVIAALFIGSEYSSGSIANWLTFVPNRNKVFASKMAALGILAVLTTIATNALAMFTSWLSTLWWHYPMDSNTDFWLKNFLPSLGYTCVIAVVATVCGGALAMLFRNAVAVIALGFAYMLGVEIILAGRFLWIGKIALSTQVDALTIGKGTYYVLNCGPDPATGYYTCNQVVESIGRSWAFAELGIITAVVIATSWWFFRTRDMDL
jgi:ABC-2 type transport system permease protein